MNKKSIYKMLLLAVAASGCLSNCWKYICHAKKYKAGTPDGDV